MTPGHGLRQRAGARVFQGFFEGLSRAASLHPSARPARHRVVVERDLAYTPSGRREHLLDVYRPAWVAPGQPAAPVVLYVHGGAFRILSKDTHWVMGLAFARRGYVVVNVSYRLAPREPFPAAVEDVCAALGWTARNAARFGGDPSRLILAGESAGANLVTSLALVTSFRRREPFARAAFDLGVMPRAVVPACGIFEVERSWRFRERWPGLHPLVDDRLREVEAGYLREAHRLSPEERELASPLHVLERDDVPDRPLPPFFIPCGTKDPLVIDSHRLEHALRARGVPVEARYWPGEVHAFHALVWREAARDCWARTYSFLDRHVPPPPVRPGS